MDWRRHQALVEMGGIVATNYVDLLQGLPFLEGAGLEVVARLTEVAVERLFDPGEVILAEGASGQQMYLIVAGQVEVVKGVGEDEILLGRRGPGELFGEMALIEERPRFATVRALEPTRLLEFSEQATQAALAQQPDLLYRIVRMLSARLRKADLQMIDDLKRKNRELARAYQELKAAQAALVEKEKLERELELARQIQKDILPLSFPQLPGFVCAARYRPARHVGGDFYDVFALDHGRAGLVMADVSNKGMSAALFMALTRSLIRAEAQRLDSPRETLLRVNRLLLEMSRANMFVTVFYGAFDPGTGRLTYVRAGHDYPLLFQAGTCQCQLLQGEGIVLGFLEGIHLEEVSVDLAPGDMLALYTDGLTDAKSRDDEFFGADRLRGAMCTLGAESPQVFCDRVFALVDDFQSGAAQYDDMALLAVKRAEV